MPSEHDPQLTHRQMSERFDLLAADAKEYAVFLVGLGGHLLCWNAGAERIFGYQSNEIMGQHFSRFFSPEDVLTGQPEHELKTALANANSAVRFSTKPATTEVRPVSTSRTPPSIPVSNMPPARTLQACNDR